LLIHGTEMEIEIIGWLAHSAGYRSASASPAIRADTVCRRAMLA
jgi:hypothetical protein